MTAEYNRNHNIEIRKIKSYRLGRCCVCESYIDKDEDVIRIKMFGINKSSISICFKCAKHMNDLIK